MSIEETIWEYKGVCFPRDLTMETLDVLPDFQIRDDDIVVATFPKTGTNWLVEIVAKILQAVGITDRSGENFISPGPLELKLPTRPHPGYVTQAETPSPRLMITHLPIEFQPKGISKPQNKVKILVPMRNPKDTVVSLYHFGNKVMELTGVRLTDNIPFDAFAQNFLNGKVPYGPYEDHVLGWWQMRDDPHFLFLKYEDMKKDLLSAVKAIVAFLEVDLDESTIKGIAEASTFNNMKADMDNSKIAERQAIARKGIIGDWKNMFSQELSEAFDTWYEKKFSGTGITFDFE
ncbi:sulfotransferase family cytosolic 1B member 1-like isoform X2 [Branchiostoma floridae]|uniref:Sulfotransferase n=1 Tax=Branchiostoma floridae TaxID=7739 RepID=A0A9J7HH24_BRAFL|nr:sulfotransferase family cytosolic 1B member 1-like isoform X2 [Branchiostoma floridae]